MNKKNDHSHDELEAPALPKYQDTYIKLATKDRTLFINEVFTKELASAASAMLLFYEQQDSQQDITIYINSPGGDAAALCQIYDVMSMIKSPIKTVCLAKCYSAGGVLLAAGTKGKRFILPHAEVMIHGLQCVFPILGEAAQADSQNYYQFLSSFNDSIMKILARHTGHPLNKIKEDCKKDMYFNAKQAVEYGLADRILGA